MKKFFYYILLSFVLFSCGSEKKFYDVEGPDVNFASAVNDEEVLVQFNEPVSSADVSFDDGKTEKIKIKNEFPTSNVYLKDNIFKDKKKKKMFIEAKDTSGNVSKKVMKAPVINTNPVKLCICQLQLKYSKTKPQNFIIKSLSDGNTGGFILGFFLRSQKIELEFTEEDIKSGEYFTVNINADKNSISNEKEITFSNKSILLTKNYRLVQTSSLIYIKDHKGQIIDYIFYYDSKVHTIEEYAETKNFKSFLHELTSCGVRPAYSDVTGNSLKNVVIKNEINAGIKENE